MGSTIYFIVHELASVVRGSIVSLSLEVLQITGRNINFNEGNEICTFSERCTRHTSMGLKSTLDGRFTECVERAVEHKLMKKEDE